MAKQFHNRDLNIVRKGVEESPFEDIYHRWLKLSWFHFFAFVMLIYVSINLIFGTIYCFLPEGIEHVVYGNIFSGFTFSIQTFSTVGYGVMYPKTNLAHFFVILECTLSMFFTALLMGAVFSKFSRPSARVVFSDKIISTTINKVPSLVLRVANVRVNSIYEGRAELSLLRSEITSEGEQIRRIISLKLIRETTPLFSLSWTLMHTIDETSPFYKMSIDEIHQSNWEVIATFSGLDQDLGQSIVAHSVFTSRMIISAKKFEDMIQVENGIRTIDFTHLNKVIIPDLDA